MPSSRALPWTSLRKKSCRQPLASMLRNDDNLYGIDEILSLSIVNVYGSIGLTNFGYLDKLKPGIIGSINDKKTVSILSL